MADKKNLIDVQEMSYCIVIGVYNLHLSVLFKAMQKSEPSASAICSSQMWNVYPPSGNITQDPFFV